SHRVAADVAETDLRHALERGRVKPRPIVTDLVEVLDILLYLIGCLQVAWHIQRRAGRGQLEWPPRVGGKQPVQLPASQDGGAGARLQPWFARAERELIHGTQLKIMWGIKRGKRTIP